MNKFYTQPLIHEKSEYLLVTRTVGSCLASSCRLHAWNEGQPQLAYVFTEPQFQRQGHARGMIEGVMNYARINGKTAILLWVHKDNAAATMLYCLIGFRRIQENGDLRMMAVQLELP